MGKIRNTLHLFFSISSYFLMPKLLFKSINQTNKQLYFLRLFGAPFLHFLFQSNYAKPCFDIESAWDTSTVLGSECFWPGCPLILDCLGSFRVWYMSSFKVQRAPEAILISFSPDFPLISLSPVHLPLFPPPTPSSCVVLLQPQLCPLTWADSLDSSGTLTAHKNYSR